MYFPPILGKPNECIGVAELEVELLTGRTHQIRGQFAALGCPLVGDAQVNSVLSASLSDSIVVSHHCVLLIRKSMVGPYRHPLQYGKKKAWIGWDHFVFPRA